MDWFVVMGPVSGIPEAFNDHDLLIMKGSKRLHALLSCSPAHYDLVAPWAFEQR